MSGLCVSEDQPLRRGGRDPPLAPGFPVSRVSLLTGGTTDRPKRVTHSYDNFHYKTST